MAKLRIQIFDSGIIVIKYVQNQKIGKQEKKSFGSNKTKGPKQDSQNQIRSPISEGGECLLN
jgi:hypothetical protein